MCALPVGRSSRLGKRPNPPPTPVRQAFIPLIRRNKHMKCLFSLSVERLGASAGNFRRGMPNRTANYCCCMSNRYSSILVQKEYMHNRTLRRFIVRQHPGMRKAARSGTVNLRQNFSNSLLRWYRQLQHAVHRPSLLHPVHADNGGNTIFWRQMLQEFPHTNHWRAKINELNGSSRINLCHHQVDNIHK